MIRGKTRQWDIATGAQDGAHAVRWTTMVCRECRNEYLRYLERAANRIDQLVVDVECFHMSDDQWPPDFRRVPVR